MNFHLIFDSDTQRCKVYDAEGVLQFACEMHDAAVNGPGFDHWGRCPRGTFPLGTPTAHDQPALGYWFTPVLITPGRSGIGIHGGGTGLADPMAPRQGWMETHGCLRVQNEDNETLVTRFLSQGGCVLTVEGD